ncbi:hypothetical protein SAMN00120144_1269 [Hymenobacter roseosalivarius DSM 11622]|uniref:Uncharacterized protein n=1 Tax=Hymenobacter roseosalivarius DSM 11622 TaxID=645990 RepID=A0A1W1W4H5_9BACT|nr:hypothetical protein [Hymenobacter roseosalivarius]SMC00515.1 hypothetical protein SAMN00120144_1269 [Hymenobacter roseosalivarius DSM 11622]
MAQAIRATGCRKPVFYNIAESPDVYDAILNASVDGVTFQWYPQGLVSGHALRGNFLPYVDEYPIPFCTDKRFISKAKMVYEFESADIIQPIMYPFMARSFRAAGFQWATQFAYDPMAIAFANNGRTQVLPMTTTSYATVEATVPAELAYPGLLRYWIVLRKGQQALTFPGGFAGQPRDWNYHHAESFSVPIVAKDTPLPLFRASLDKDQVEARGIASTAWTDYVTTPAGELALRLVVGQPKLGQAKPSAGPGPSAALRAYFGHKLAGRTTEVAGFTEVIVKAQANQPATSVKVVLMTKDATAYSAMVQLGAEERELRIPLTAFRPDALLLLPRSYPGFLPLTYQSANQPATLKLTEAEVLQVVLEGVAPASGQLYVDLESVYLQ